jgi:hypothetical protein
MKRFGWVGLFILLTTAILAADPQQVLKKDQLYLIFDPRLQGIGENCQLKLHSFQRHPLNPLVKPEHPWEAIGESKDIGLTNKGRIQLGTVLWDEQEQIFKMWYFGYTGETACCYATSHDGVHWIKPSLGLREYQGSKDNNIWAFNAPCSIYQDNNASDPAKRYVAWGLQLGNGDDGHKADNCLYRFFSCDGLNWRRERNEPVLPGHPAKYLGGTAADSANVYRFDWLNKYVCFYNISYPNDNPAPQDQRKNKNLLRSIARFESGDGITWNADSPTWVFKRDEKDKEYDPYIQFYGHTPLIHTVGDLYLGLTWLFHSNEGTIELGFSYSTDTVTWHRPFRGEYVLPLSEPGQWDSAMITASNLLVEKDGLWWLYYNGCPYRHRGGDEFPGEGKRYFAIGLAQMPVGRIVSAQCWRKGGNWTVGPLQLTGKTLFINAAILDHVNVSLLDDKDQPLPEFASGEIQGNALEIPVIWKGSKDLAALQNQSIKIRFELNDAEIFGFMCR